MCLERDPSPTALFFFFVFVFFSFFGVGGVVQTPPRFLLAMAIAPSGLAYQQVLAQSEKDKILSGFSRIDGMSQLPQRPPPPKKSSKKSNSASQVYSPESMGMMAKFCAFLREVESPPSLQQPYHFLQIGKVVMVPHWPAIFRCRAILVGQLLPRQQMEHYLVVVEDILYLLDGMYQDTTEEHYLLREKASLFKGYLVEHTFDPDNVLPGLPACPVAQRNFQKYIRERRPPGLGE